MPMFLPPADVEARHPCILNKTLGPAVFRRGRGDPARSVYSYMPEFEKNTKELLAAPPKSYGNHQFGLSVGRGAFVFPRGQWVTVAERVKLNDPGEENGNANGPSVPATRESSPGVQANLNFGSMGRLSFLWES